MPGLLSVCPRLPGEFTLAASATVKGNGSVSLLRLIRKRDEHHEHVIEVSWRATR